MLEFNASSYTVMVSALNELEDIFRFDEAAGGRDAAKSQLTYVVDSLSEMGLRVSAKKAARILEGCMTIERRHMVTDLSDLRDRITDELEDTLFFQLDGAEAAFYKTPALFGDAVERAFPSASAEISEAGKCRALGRYSACVFHLMRATEVGLKALAGALNLQFEHESWNYALDHIEKAVKEMNSSRGPDWKLDQQFYSEAAVHLRLIKNAWRNYAMHILDTYTEETAADVYNHVSALLRQLSTRLREA